MGMRALALLVIVCFAVSAPAAMAQDPADQPMPTVIHYECPDGTSGTLTLDPEASSEDQDNARKQACKDHQVYTGPKYLDYPPYGRCPDMTPEVASGAIYALYGAKPLPGMKAYHDKPESKLRPWRVYTAPADAVVSYGGTKREIDAGTVFSFDCGREAGENRNTVSTMDVVMGSITAKLKPHDGFGTLESATKPNKKNTTSVTVTRAATDVTDLFRLIAQHGVSWAGKTTITQHDVGAGELQITPYVGAKSGHCQYNVKAATAISKGRRKGGSASFQS